MPARPARRALTLRGATAFRQGLPVTQVVEPMGRVRPRIRAPAVWGGRELFVTNAMRDILGLRAARAPEEQPILVMEMVPARMVFIREEVALVDQTGWDKRGT